MASAAGGPIIHPQDVGSTLMEVQPSSPAARGTEQETGDEMGRKFKLAALLGMVLAALMTSMALARVPWTGNGADSIRECAEGQDPYLHWVLTPNGNKKPESAALYVNSDAYAMGHRGNSAALHAVTPYHDPDTLTAYAEESPEGSANNLVISDGCRGQGPEPSPSPSPEPSGEPSPEPTGEPGGPPTPGADPADPVEGPAPFTG